MVVWIIYFKWMEIIQSIQEMLFFGIQMQVDGVIGENGTTGE